MPVLDMLINTVEEIKTSDKYPKPTILAIPGSLLESLIYLDDVMLSEVMLEVRNKGWKLKSERIESSSRAELWENIRTTESTEDGVVYLLRFIASYYKPSIEPIQRIFKVLEIKDEVLYGV